MGDQGDSEDIDGLLALPSDLLARVCTLLAPRDVAALACTCRRLRHLHTDLLPLFHLVTAPFALEDVLLKLREQDELRTLRASLRARQISEQQYRERRDVVLGASLRSRRHDLGAACAGGASPAHPRWCVQRVPGVLEPYPQRTSDKLEACAAHASVVDIGSYRQVRFRRHAPAGASSAAPSAGGNMSVRVDDGCVEIQLVARGKRSSTKPHRGSAHPVVRGTWFFSSRTANRRVYAYNHAAADVIEAAHSAGHTTVILKDGSIVDLREMVHDVRPRATTAVSSSSAAAGGGGAAAAAAVTAVAAAAPPVLSSDDADLRDVFRGFPE